MARALSAGGAGRGDIIHNAYGYGLFTGGLGVHYGAERLGASVIPVSGGNTQHQVMIMKDFGPTILTATPSYTLHLAEVAKEMGVAFDSLKFKFGIFGAEPWSEKMREEIQRKLNLTAEVKGLQNLERRITNNIKELLGVSARVKLVEPKTIERSQGKAVRVVDNRTI